MQKHEIDVFLPQELQKFKERCGYRCNLDSPKSFCEKLMYKKIINQPWEKTFLHADKIQARQFVPDKYLIKAMSKYLDIEHLKPNFPCVIKMNNASGRNIFIFEPNSFKDEYTDNLVKWQKLPYGYANFEWDAVYKYITPGVLIETEILPIPHDVYRFNVFHGKVEFINVYDSFIDGKLHYSSVTTYDRAWNFIPVYLKGLPAKYPVKAPKELDEMIELAETLCKDFDYVRFDLYNIGGRIIFNEFTFYPLSCKIKTEPVKYDYQWGEML